MRCGGILLGIVMATAMAMPAAAQTAATPPLVREAEIPLGAVTGRIDHLAIDLKRQRLYVAELGNNTLAVVDLATRTLRQSIPGFSEPQGVAYEPVTDTVYVSNAGDGSVRVLRGDDLAPLARIELGDDADNIRIDAKRKRLLVGYGNGAVVLLDPATHAKLGELALNGHPEGFQIDAARDRLFVNVPRRAEIVMIDLASGAVRSIPTGGMRSNFPMAIDAEAGRVLTAFRNPPLLMALSAEDGSIVARLGTCGTADDLFTDSKRHRLYVICGDGSIDVIQPEGKDYRRITSIPTLPSARTGLFVPELDRLYVAVAATGTAPAAIWIYRPNP